MASRRPISAAVIPFCRQEEATFFQRGLWILLNAAQLLIMQRPSNGVGLSGGVRHLFATRK